MSNTNTAIVNNPLRASVHRGRHGRFDLYVAMDGEATEKNMGQFESFGDAADYAHEKFGVRPSLSDLV